MGIIMDADRNQEYLERQEKIGQKTEEDIPAGYNYSSGAKVLRDVYIPPEEMAELEELYSKVVVQDFEDDYHMSREEREEMRERYSKFFRLKRQYTKKIRRLDKYIDACRLIYSIIQDTAREQTVMSEEKFIKDTLRGKIHIEGLTLPKYQGRGKKTLNWDYIAEAIMDPSIDITQIIESQKRLSTEEDDEIVSPDDLSVTMSPEELESLHKAIEANEEKQVRIHSDELDEGFATIETDKERKKLLKAFPEYSKKLKENYERSRSKVLRYHLQDEDMQYIREFQQFQNDKNQGSYPVFEGSLMDEDAVGRYLFEVEQWEQTHEFIKYGSAMITKEQEQEIEFKKVLEENGWNLRNLYGNKEREKQIQREKRQNHKKIKSLKKMLSQLQDKEKAQALKGLDGEKIKVYSTEDIKNGVNTKKKKKSKKAKKKSKAFNGILMDAAGRKEGSFKEYERKMKDFSWKGDED
jgi:hypothetical protein